MSVSLSVELKDKFVKGHMINQGGKYYSMKNREKYKWSSETGLNCQSDH